MRDSFVFYRSFYEAINGLPNDVQVELYKAIFEYSLNFNEIELTGLANSVFKLVKPQLDANIRKYKNGKLGAEFGVNGGRPPKHDEINPTETPKKPLNNPTETPNDNVNDNVNDNTSLRSEQFEKFWEFYGKHGAKKTAKQRFMKLTETEMDALRKHLPKYLKSTPDIKFRKHAERYLSLKLWENGDIEKLSQPIEYFTNQFDYWNRDLTPEEWKRVPPDKVQKKKENDMRRAMGV